MTVAAMHLGRSARQSIPRGPRWFGSLAALLISALRHLDRWLWGRPSKQPAPPKR